MRAIRSLLLFKLGFWSGVMAAAVFAKKALPSHGDEDSDEVGLVAIFDGIKLTNRSRAFRGGSMLAWWGGIAVDLREAELAPDARLSVRTLFGGIAIKTPPDWRVESDVRAVMGGVDVKAPAEAADAPVLTVEGMALFGGVAIKAKAEDAAAAVAEPVGE